MRTLSSVMHHSQASSYSISANTNLYLEEVEYRGNVSPETTTISFQYMRFLTGSEILKYCKTPILVLGSHSFCDCNTACDSFAEK